MPKAPLTTGQNLLLMGASALLTIAAFWLYYGYAAHPIPIRGSRHQAPKSAPAETQTPVPEATPSPTTAQVAPTPPVLPASNAFTTLDDYRRRRAMAPQTPPPLVTPPPGRTPETELGRVTFLVRDYRAAFGSNPVGSNKEITRTLLGDNPRGTRFLDPATVTLDSKGELLDAWGRPYFFHAMSGTIMEIRSAGPDGKLFTVDDLVR